MKKLILLVLVLLTICSCSKEEEPEYILDPLQQYFIIDEGETKVESFQIEFHGTYTVSYTIYDSELNNNLKEVKGEEILDSGVINVEGSRTFEYPSGFVFFEYEIQNLQEKGQLKLLYNITFEAIPQLFVDELNMGFEVAIPFKYSASDFQ